MPRYIVEFFDHPTKTKMIEYAQGYDEVDAALSILDEAPPRYPKMNIGDIRELSLENNLQFIGIMVDTFMAHEHKINVVKKMEAKTGERHEISKSTKRSNHKKSRKRQKAR